MPSLNKFQAIANLCADAEIRQVGSNSVAAFRIAISERYKAQDGQTAERTEFFSVDYWNPGGFAPYLKKGTMIYLEGSLRTDKYTAQDGTERERVKIKAFSIQLLKVPDAPAQQPAQPQQPYYPQQAPYAPPQYQAPAPPPQYQAPVPPTPPAPPQPPRPAAPTPPPYQQAPPPTIEDYVPENHADDLPFR